MTSFPDKFSYRMNLLPKKGLAEKVSIFKLSPKIWLNLEIIDLKGPKIRPQNRLTEFPALLSFNL